MSCTNCNNSSPCGCKDTALTTPCGYTQCGIGNERCDDVQCAECVSYCGTSFQVTTPEGVLKIDSGERLDQIIQKFSYEEIAAKLNVPLGTVKAQLHRSREILFKILKNKKDSI